MKLLRVNKYIFINPEAIIKVEDAGDYWIYTLNSGEMINSEYSPKDFDLAHTPLYQSMGDLSDQS